MVKEVAEGNDARLAYGLATIKVTPVIGDGREFQVSGSLSVFQCPACSGGQQSHPRNVIVRSAGQQEPDESGNYRTRETRARKEVVV